MAISNLYRLAGLALIAASSTTFAAEARNHKASSPARDPGIATASGVDVCLCPEVTPCLQLSATAFKSPVESGGCVVSLEYQRVNCAIPDRCQAETEKTRTKAATAGGRPVAN